MNVYADNAATTAVSKTALAAMLPCFQEVYGNPSSLHSPGQRAAEKLAAARGIFARHLNAESREITFTSGGSEADNQALRSAAALGARKGKRHIVSTKFEHHAILHTLDALAKEGFEITLLDIPPDGVVTAEQVKAALRPDTCLVTVMFANNEIGTIQPIAEIGEVCHEAGVLFHTDAVQAAGHLPIDVRAMHIDLLSLSAHKFHGPKGVGVLYARRGIPLVNVIYGGAQERGKRAGTENIPGRPRHPGHHRCEIQHLRLRQRHRHQLHGHGADQGQAHLRSAEAVQPGGGGGPGRPAHPQDPLLRPGGGGGPRRHQGLLR